MNVEEIVVENFQTRVRDLTEDVDGFLRELVPPEPSSLYDPVRHILSAGGKRVRPILTALAAYASESGTTPNWVAAGTAVELLHTFTLVHDDIMDNAETRRGKPAVHIAYGRDAAILSGDVMIGLATRALSGYQGEWIREMLHEFSLGFVRVCEGQALDKAYENRHDIAHTDYHMMIRFKTASIFELSAVLGAYVGGAHYVEPLRQFARHIGLAFQMSDDLLDLTAEHASFGKMIGGDILEGKRTFLFVEAMEHYATMTVEEKAFMDRIASHSATTDDIPIAQMLFARLGVLDRTRNMIEEETRTAQIALAALPDSEHRGMLLSYSEFLLSRAM
jgi:geranylgeranyl diphosphate synthase type II